MQAKKSVLITGASRGIGKAIAYEFAKQGYDLYLTCKNNIPLLEQIKSDVEKTKSPAKNLPLNIESTTDDPKIFTPIHCHIFQCDMGSMKEVEQLFSSIPSIDVIVNNAGISHVGLLTDMTEEEWQNVMSTNIDSLFYTSKYGVPKMLQKHQGKIINISSVWGNVGASMEVAYSASKGAMNSFTKALAKELAPSNIQVNAISCGFINTDMNSCFSAEDLQSIIEEIPANRVGEPEEVAKLCILLAQAPEYLTGQIITLDGGWIS
ncbi:MAG: SDR family NAD(P)-dependent oxidoreductase [Lachnospiraceae bacterium]|nr:SDR family NAD(P)-dependent oxidoreductase [Lachnospiraceae bacterium]